MILKDELPFVPLDVVEHVEQVYNIDYLLSSSSCYTSDERLGYIKGVREVVTYLRALAIRKDGED